MRQPNRRDADLRHPARNWSSAAGDDRSGPLQHAPDEPIEGAGREPRVIAFAANRRFVGRAFLATGDAAPALCPTRIRDLGRHAGESLRLEMWVAKSMMRAHANAVAVVAQEDVDPITEATLDLG